MYFVFKHLHTTLAVLVMVWFLLRFMLRLVNRDSLQKHLIKIPAMIFDVGLLLMAVAVWMMSGIGFADWLIMKMVLLICYIMFAFRCLKRAESWFAVVLNGVLGWVSLAMAMYLAFQKPPLF